MTRTRYFFSLLAIGLFALCMAVGCGRTEHVGARADSLRPALLGGYYFYRGVGGVDALLNYADRAGEDNFRPVLNCSPIRMRTIRAESWHNCCARRGV